LQEIYEDEFWFKAFLHNHQTKIFSLTEDDRPETYMHFVEIDRSRFEAAKERLAGIDIVALQEESRGALDAVHDRWGWPRQKKEWWILRDSSDIHVPEGLRERIAADNAWDVELYEWAAETIAVRGPRNDPRAMAKNRKAADLTEKYNAAIVGLLPRIVPQAGRERPDLYLDLLERSVLGLLVEQPTSMKRDGVAGPLEVIPLEDVSIRLYGRDWPHVGETMVGLQRLENVRTCVEQALDDNVPGDLIEAGVWRGGTSIFMRAILAARRVDDRRVWVADSFAGLPPPDAAYPVDAGSQFHLQPYLSVPESEVRSNFERYGLLDDQVVFLKGWFHESLEGLGDECFAVVRLDGDLYGSTMASLQHLYPRLSPGGFLIVDDYYGLPMCGRAVDDFRSVQGIEDPIVPIDWCGGYWRKSV